MSDSLNDSQVSMWSTLVALAKADGKVKTEERKFIEDAIQKLVDATGTQKAAILNVFHSSKTPEFYYQGVTSPRDRSQLIYLARLMFYSDGDFSAQEERILQAFTETTMSRVSLEKAMHEVDEVTDQFLDRHESFKKSKSLMSRFADALTFWDDYV